MKKIAYLIITLVLSLWVNESLSQQGVAINTSNTPPDASAMLDVSSEIGGVLIPRMTWAQRNAITDPAEGLLVFQIDNTPGFYYYDGLVWGLIGSGAFAIDDLADGISIGYSIYLGANAGTTDDGTDNSNVAIGHQAMKTIISAERNVALGLQALMYDTTGNYNTAIGFQASKFNTHGTNNTTVGLNANLYNMEGSNNTIIGSEAGKGFTLHSKSGNVFLGYRAGFKETGDNKLYIDNSDTTKPLIYGEFVNDSVAVNGKLRVANTVYASAYSSTSPLKLQTNGTTRIYVDAGDGNVGIGTTSPHESSIVDLTTNSKGFLPPRLSLEEIKALTNPADGLQVYNSDDEKLYIFVGSMSRWRALSYGTEIINPPALFNLGTGGLCNNTNIYGSFRTGDTLTDSEKVTISVNVSFVGDYTVSTDTVNGYSFIAVGTFYSTGIQIVELQASGVPISDQTDTFTVSANNNTGSCEFNITVIYRPPCGTSFVDSRDGHSYNIVRIFNNCWMSENLAYLPSVYPSDSSSSTTPYYYVYDYEGTSVAAAMATDNYQTYGALYNWPAVMNGEASSDSVPSGVQGICPDGWYVPSNAEWTVLRDYLGVEDAGGKMKEEGTSHWNPPNYGATNSSGFTGLPGGVRTDSGDGSFVLIGSNGDFWSSFGLLNNLADEAELLYNSDGLGLGFGQRSNGYSVRCIRNY